MTHTHPFFSVRIFLLLTLLVSFFSSVPQTSAAYEVTGQSVTRLTESTVLYTITYKFGFLNREAYLPIVTKRSTATAVSDMSVSFGFQNGEQEPFMQGESAALVLSDAVMKDTSYYLPEGKSAEFTLVAFLKIPQHQEPMTSDVSLQIHSLPLVLVKDEKTQLFTVSPEELVDYQTETIRL